VKGDEGMAREIDVVSAQAAQAKTVVEKATNVAWNFDELQEAGAVGAWSDEDRLVQANSATVAGVSGPFPGCLQRTGATEEFDHYSLIGQTRHFLIFERPD
jgi:hypothetical protein